MVNETQQARSYKKYDYFAYKNMLLSVKWDDIVHIENPDEMWNKIIKVINACLDSMCPIRTLVLPVFTPEWLTPTIINAMNDRDKLYTIAKHTNSTDDWRIANFHRNRVEAMISLSRK